MKLPDGHNFRASRYQQLGPTYHVQYHRFTIVSALNGIEIDQWKDKTLNKYRELSRHIFATIQVVYLFCVESISYFDALFLRLGCMARFYDFNIKAVIPQEVGFRRVNIGS